MKTEYKSVRFTINPQAQKTVPFLCIDNADDRELGKIILSQVWGIFTFLPTKKHYALTIKQLKSITKFLKEAQHYKRKKDKL